MSRIICQKRHCKKSVYLKLFLKIKSNNKYIKYTAFVLRKFLSILECYPLKFKTVLVLIKFNRRNRDFGVV